MRVAAMQVGVSILVLALLISSEARSAEDAAAHAIAQKFAVQGADEQAKAADAAKKAAADAKAKADTKRRLAAQRAAEAKRKAFEAEQTAKQLRADEVDMLARARAEAEERRRELEKAQAELAQAEAERAAAEAKANDDTIAREVAEAAAARAAKEAEARRIAELDAAKKDDQARKQDEAERAAKEAEAKRVADAAAAAKKAEDERRQADAEAAKKADVERAAREAEARRVAEAAAAEAKRLADIEAAKKADEARQLAEAERASREAEAKRVAEVAAAAKKADDERRRADAEAAKKAEAERAAKEADDMRLAEQRRLFADDQHDTKPAETKTAVLPVVSGLQKLGAAAPSAATRVTVLLTMDAGDRGIRRFDKTADPMLCVAESCYISAGPDKPAEQMTRGKAFGPGVALGTRGGACRNSLTCVFRGVDLEKAVAMVQPIDLRIVRHDRREPSEVSADDTCKVSGGRLSCVRTVRGKDYRAWIVPEPVADKAGGEVLTAAFGPSGLN